MKKGWLNRMVKNNSAEVAMWSPEMKRVAEEQTGDKMPEDPRFTEIAKLRAEVERLDSLGQKATDALDEVNLRLGEATARAEAAEKKAERLRAEVAAICRITKGNAADLTKPVDTVAGYVTEMRGRVNDLTARAEVAEGRAAGLYRALCDAVRASGGVANDGISDTFLILGVPAEMAARKKAQEAAERERDEAQSQVKHWREAAMRENGRAMEHLNSAAEAQAQVAYLRGALGHVQRNTHGHRDLSFADSCWQVATESLARTPAKSLGRLKAEALRELAEKMRGMDMDIGAEIAETEADRLEKEATNGR